MVMITMSHEQESLTPEGSTVDVLWQAVCEKDSRFDGLLFYGVTTTGIYCKPGCPARRPLRTNVEFFATPQGAEARGLRPCKRCRPALKKPESLLETLVLEACRRLEAYRDLAPRVSELAQELEVSERRLRDSFREVLGISPGRYSQALRMNRLRSSLRAGASVTDAIYEAGFGSPSRLYEKADRQLGMTPATYRRGGAGIQVHYQVASCTLGYLLVAGTEKGLCCVRIGKSHPQVLAELRKEFHRADLLEDADSTAKWMQALLNYLAGSEPWPMLPLDVRATAFRAKVWETLRKIPAGATASYGQIAAQIGRPTAARAVAQACATNPVALAVPCHRVVPMSGGSGGYRWGVEVKKTLLELEAE